MNGERKPKRAGADDHVGHGHDLPDVCNPISNNRRDDFMNTRVISEEEMTRYKKNHLRIWRRFIRLVQEGKLTVVRDSCIGIGCDL